MSVPKQPLSNNGSLLIRFTYKGYRYQLTRLGKYVDPVARKNAQTICDRISLDIASDNFKSKNNSELEEKYHPTVTPSRELDLVEVLKERLENNFNSADKSLLSHLQKFKKEIRTESDARAFMNFLKDRDLANSTLQRYLNTLKAVSSLFKGVKVKSDSKPLPKPFTRLEVQEIREWFKVNYPVYYDFVSVLFLTGMRTSEAIGLRWQDVDFDAMTLTISSSLSSPKRDGKRVRKPTKNLTVRVFPLSGELLKIFLERSKGTPESLIFTSLKGLPIDDHTFSQRQWKKCLKELQIHHRKFYNTRHTFISHFLVATKDVVKCASLTHGTKTGVQTILKHYAGLIDRVEVPDLYS